MGIVAKMVLILSLSVFVLPFLTLTNTNENIIFAEVNTGVNVGEKAAPFKLMTVDGKELELESFAKDKVTLLVFGATWCPACRHEIPILKEYYNEFKDDGLNILNIDIQESEKKVKSFVEKQQINYPVALDSNAAAARLYKVVGIPLNVILDRSGVIVYKENRPPGKEILEKLLID
ncbi:MAG: Thiol-disulfide oxidoreductase ResA [Candidatus Scalindua arabica]|uniref:Thiol-disulfide oxidoreductase ResA n=1 Tax=Candidatus Scalindua arabica TaxID=1127984 RepID=A0A942A630_9BACT|nr:Thiol-disulfide oxidoreductase ResA [Candidatus Scalindua arabica]